MPPKKKAPANSYFFFMTELKNKQGNRNRPMSEIAHIAAPLWANMSKEQRKPYEDMAAIEKGNRGKCTSSGKDLDLAVKEERDVQEKIEQMREDIRHLVTFSHKTGSLKDDVFFIIHVNVFCHHSAQNRWYPAEIAVASFTLNDGVDPQEVFHEFVNPGPLPLGYAAEAKLHAEKTHQLNKPDFDDESNMEEVVTKMLKFLESKSPKKTRPILYANEHHMEMIKNVLDAWSYDYKKPKITLYELEYLLTTLRNTAAGTKIWHSDTFASRELEKDVNNYCRDISCSYHEGASLQVHCSKSIVTRYVYVICDNCCLDLGIELIRGRHVPADAKTLGLNKRVKSTNSISSYSESSGRSTVSSRTLTNEEEEEDTSTVRSESWDTQSNISTMTFDSDFPSLGVKPRKPAAAVTNAAPTTANKVDIWQKIKPSYPVNSLTQGVGNINLSQQSLNSNSQFPPLGRGRGGLMSGQGRGSHVGLGRGRGNPL